MVATSCSRRREKSDLNSPTVSLATDAALRDAPAERPSVNPATVEVVRHAFISGADQMRRNLYRSAYSPVIYEMKDCSVGIFDANGDLLGQAPGLPFFLGSLGGTIKAVLGAKTKHDFEEGDVWIVNDSAICGSHLNDITLIQPILIEGALRGFSAAKAHWTDVGAMEAGYVGTSTNIFQEGLRIPFLRLVHRGVTDPQLCEIFALNSRQPTALLGDLMAEVAACRTGAERFHAIVDRYGWPAVESSIQSFFEHAELEDRAAVGSIPDGLYHSQGFLDGDGHSDNSLHVAVTVAVAGDEMTIDLEGSSPECEGSINSGLVQTCSAMQQAFKFIVNPSTPACGGNFRNLQIKVPEGSCFYPSATAAYLHYGPHLLLATDLVVRALTTAVPERTAAGHLGDSCNVTLVNERGQAPYVFGDSLVVGWGAYPGGDGESALIRSSAGDFRSFPTETAEHRFPVRITKYALRVGSGGDGEWRGGLGLEREYEVLQDCRASLWFERTKMPAWGIAGGEDGARPEVWVTLPTQQPKLVLMATAMPLPAGTMILARTGGGGGWGNPSERDPEAIAADERLGLLEVNL